MFQKSVAFDLNGLYHLDNGQFHIWIWKIICIMHWNRVLSFKFQVASKILSFTPKTLIFYSQKKKRVQFCLSARFCETSKKLSYSAFHWKAIHFTSFYGSLWSCQDSTDLLCHETKKRVNRLYLLFPKMLSYDHCLTKSSSSTKICPL